MLVTAPQKLGDAPLTFIQIYVVQRLVGEHAGGGEQGRLCRADILFFIAGFVVDFIVVECGLLALTLHVCNRHRGHLRDF